MINSEQHFAPQQSDIDETYKAGADGGEQCVHFQGNFLFLGNSTVEKENLGKRKNLRKSKEI